MCVEVSIGACYILWWVWLERCRDGSYAVNALRCDGWVVCACVVMCIVACFVGFWESVILVEVHPYTTCFCSFWRSAFSIYRRELA